MAPSQVKMALQAGATYMPDGGLMGAGAGSVNFMASRKIGDQPARPAADGLIGGLLAAPSGAMYWDGGTLANRLYAGTGIRLLSLLQAPLAWLNIVAAANRRPEPDRRSATRWRRWCRSGCSTARSPAGPAGRRSCGATPSTTRRASRSCGATRTRPTATSIMWGDVDDRVRSGVTRA